MNQLPPPDIPRIYTAAAEWLACLIYILPQKKRFNNLTLTVILAFSALGLWAIHFTAGRLPIAFWLPGMLIAVLFMYGNILLSCDISPVEAGYSWARAFIAAEFSASLGWQLYISLFWQNNLWNTLWQFLSMSAAYLLVFGIIAYLEHRKGSLRTIKGITGKELASALLIALAAFSISNLYFILPAQIAGATMEGLFHIRTLVHLSGITMLYAFHEQRCEIQLRHEVEAMNHVLVRQYEQYQAFKANSQTLNHQYHDLKHKLAIIRNEKDPQKRETYLEDMDQSISRHEAQVETGNGVLDTVLTSKSLACAEKGISLTCVADGSLLNFISVMDICTIFGNALDNAIESTEKLPQKDQRLIKLAVYSQNNFLMIRFENYIRHQIPMEDGIPPTTKKDSSRHGYGIKSIKHTAEKYGGTVTIHTENNWFVLRILLPLQPPAPTL